MSLERSYGGMKQNPLADKAFYCYTIYDTEYDKYYSGAKTQHTEATPLLLVKYFTSTTVVDFAERIRKYTDRFEYIIEYFHTPEEAFDAETEHHAKYNVAGDPQYYNVINAGGSVCGAGTVPCVDDTGAYYRISMEEYELNRDKHVHASTGLVNVYDKRHPEKGLHKVSVADYNTEYHVSELAGHTHVYDKVLGRNVRISLDEYNSNLDRYCGITRGMVACYDTVNGVTRQVPKEEFDADNTLVGITSKLNPYATKTSKGVPKSRIGVILKETLEVISITKDEYNENKGLYLNTAVKMIYLCDGVAHTAKSKLKGKEFETFTLDEFKQFKGKYTWAK